MEVLPVGIAFIGGYIVYKTFATPEPQPKDGNPDGTALPAPKFLYSEPRIWISAPVDVTYKPYTSFFGPNNDPRRAHLLYGGSRVVLSGYNPVTQTNQVWPENRQPQPSGKPSYTAQPIKGIGVPQAVNSKTVFTD